MAESERYCNNCKRSVAAANFACHSAFCPRNIIVCEECDEPIHRWLRKGHQEEYHISVICDMCKISIQKWRLEKHQKEVCTKRRVICEFCNAYFSIDDIQEHIVFCGSRTKKCPLCSRFIMFKHEKKHMEVHAHAKKYYSKNDSGEVHQNTMNEYISKTSEKEDVQAKVERCSFCKTSLNPIQIYVHEKECVYRPTNCPDCSARMLIKDTYSHCCKQYKENRNVSEIELLSKNFKDLFINENCWDTVLQVADKEFKAHRTVLIARSPVFSAMFQHDTSEKQTGEVKVPDCDPESFKEFLEYLYSGKLENLSSCSALNLYTISDKYQVQELKSFCTKYLMRNITSENMCDAVILADTYDETELLSAIQYFFNKNFKEIVMSSAWEYLLKKNFRLANKLLIEKVKAE